MLLTLPRSPSIGGTTIGRLFADGDFLAYTLEDEIRAPGVKVPGQTAIPPGLYEIKMVRPHRKIWSPREDGLLPQLQGVPNFTGIFIHSLNCAEETEGCIGVGKLLDPSGDRITFSRPALVEVCNRIVVARDMGEGVKIEIRNPDAEG